MEVVKTILECSRVEVKRFINIFLIIINCEVDTGSTVKNFL